MMHLHHLILYAAFISCAHAWYCSISPRGRLAEACKRPSRSRDVSYELFLGDGDSIIDGNEPKEEAEIRCVWAIAE